MYRPFRASARNPFQAFLVDADRILDVGLRPEVLANLSQADCADFTRNEEQRNFARGIYCRIEHISFAFERLCELTDEYHHFNAAIDENRDASGTHAYSNQEVSQLVRWHVEAETLTRHIYYELKSVVDMIDEWGISPRAGSELEYALKCRDRFLSHSQLGGVSPRARPPKSIPTGGGFTRCHITGFQIWGPVSRSQYLSELGIAEPVDPTTEATEKAKAEATIVKGRPNESLAPADVTRIKAFGVKEPDLEAALREFATELAPGLLTKMDEIAREALAKLGFVPGPGPSAQLTNYRAV